MRWQNLLFIFTLAPMLGAAEPNIEGYWDPEIGGTYSLTNPSRGNVDRPGDREQGVQKASRVVDPPDGQIPYQPWARIKQQYIQANIKNPVKPEFIDTQARCLPGGPIRATFWHTVHILQYPGYVLFEYEGSHPFRIVPLDGRPHAASDVKLWMGDSRGHWEGNTLVVDVTSYNGKSRLSNVGDFTSDKAHIVERYTFIDNKTLKYQATIDDPSVYTRPWTMESPFHRGHARERNYEQWEEACHEGERNVADTIVEGTK
jgi:hypothetical protein